MPQVSIRMESGGQVAQQGRGKADCGEHCQASGVKSIQSLVSMSRLGRFLSRSLVAGSFLKDFVRHSLPFWDHPQPSLAHVQPSLLIMRIECFICHPKAMDSVGSILVRITHGDTPNFASRIWDEQSESP